MRSVNSTHEIRISYLYIANAYLIRIKYANSFPGCTSERASEQPVADGDSAWMSD